MPIRAQLFWCGLPCLVGACAPADGLPDKADTPADTAPLVHTDIPSPSLGVLVDVDPAADGVREARPAGTSVGLTVRPTQMPAGVDIGITLTSGGAGAFSIDPVTGVVTTTAPLDHELTATHTLTFTATAQGYAPATGTFVVPVVNDPNPTLRVDFPLAGESEGDSISARGLVSDPDGQAVTVVVETAAGVVDAVVDGDGWSAASVPLGAGGLVTVTATDEVGEVTVQQVPVGRSVSLAGPKGITIDPTGTQAAVAVFQQLVMVDLATGGTEVLTGPKVAPTDIAFDDVQEVVYSTTRQMFYVLDRTGLPSAGRIIAVHPVTGRRTVVSATTGPTLRGSGPALGNVTDIDYDEANQRIVAVNQRAVMFIQPGTGHRTSMAVEPAMTPEDPFQSFQHVAIDASGETLHTWATFLPGTACCTTAPATIDLVSQTWTTHGTPRLIGVHDLALDDEAGVVWMSGNELPDGLIGSYDASGSDITYLPTAPLNLRAGPLAVSDGDLFLVDRDRATLYRADPNGQHVPVPRATAGSGAPLTQPAVVSAEPGGGAAWVLQRDGLIHIDLSTGQRTTVSDGSTGAGPMWPDDPVREGWHLEVDASRATAWVARTFPNALFEVDLVSGDRIDLYDGTVPDDSCSSVRGLHVQQDTLSIACAQLGRLGGEFIGALDLTARTFTTVVAPSRWWSTSGLHVNAAGTTAWGVGDVWATWPSWYDDFYAVFALDVATGTFTNLSEVQGGHHTYVDLVVDPAETHAWVLAEDPSVLWWVDLATGAAEPRASAELGRGPVPGTWGGTTLLGNDVLLLVDRMENTVLAIDGVTGDRMIIAD